jgi:deoxyribodipyrimidine photolyase-related protein
LIWLQHVSPDNFGDPTSVWFATCSTQAGTTDPTWIDAGLPKFGDFQDAMLEDQPFLTHKLSGFYLNAGWTRLEVCREVETAYQVTAAERGRGFVRSLAGGANMRGIYFRGASTPLAMLWDMTAPYRICFWDCADKDGLLLA